MDGQAVKPGVVCLLNVDGLCPFPSESPRDSREPVGFPRRRTRLSKLLLLLLLMLLLVWLLLLLG